MITVHFDRERETLRTIRWKERVYAGELGPRIGILYLTKTAVAEMGNPETLRITIEDGDVEEGGEA